MRGADILEAEKHFGDFRLFVYGTLKQGFVNHERFFPGGAESRPACVPGVLFDTPWNHPVARIPSNCILAYGSSSVCADLAVQCQFRSWVDPNAAVKSTDSPYFSGQILQGEILILDDPDRDLPKLDAFEEYTPGSSSSRFQRILVWTLWGDLWIAAWMYAGGSIFENHKFQEIPTGSWPPPWSPDNK